MAEIIDVEQGSDAWHAMRAGGIGASECAAVLEESPFESAFGLWCRKTGQTEPKKDNERMKHGRDSEPIARAQYIAESDVTLEPYVAKMDGVPFIFASADGWNPELQIGVEIKCPTEERLYRDAREGQIPRYYLIQMVQQMAVFEAPRWDFYVWYQNEGIIITLRRDEPLTGLDGLTPREYWEQVAFPAAAVFWERVTNREWPPISNAEPVQVNDPAWARDMAGRDQASRMVHEAKSQKDAMDASLRRLAGDSKVAFGQGWRSTWVYYRPRHTVVVTLDSAEAQTRMLKALETVRSREGVVKIEASTWAPKLTFRVARDKES